MLFVNLELRDALRMISSLLTTSSFKAQFNFMDWYKRRSKSFAIALSLQLSLISLEVEVLDLGGGLLVRLDCVIFLSFSSSSLFFYLQAIKLLSRLKTIQFSQLILFFNYSVLASLSFSFSWQRSLASLNFERIYLISDYYSIISRILSSMFFKFAFKSPISADSYLMNVYFIQICLAKSFSFYFISICVASTIFFIEINCSFVCLSASSFSLRSYFNIFIIFQDCSHFFFQRSFIQLIWNDFYLSSAQYCLNFKLIRAQFVDVSSSNLMQSYLLCQSSFLKNQIQTDCDFIVYSMFFIFYVISEGTFSPFLSFSSFACSSFIILFFYYNYCVLVNNMASLRKSQVLILVNSSLNIGWLSTFQNFEKDLVSSSNLEFNFSVKFDDYLSYSSLNLRVVSQFLLFVLIYWLSGKNTTCSDLLFLLVQPQ